MARKKTDDAAQTADPKKVVSISRKTPMEWMNLLATVKKDHWRILRVTIQLRDRLMAGKPAALDAAEAMIAARGLKDHLEAKLIEKIESATPEQRDEMAEEVKDEGKCEFHRREGKPGIWFPTNNVKAGVKENWSVLGFRVEDRGSRGALAEGVFVYSVQPEGADPAERDWIYLGEKPATDPETGLDYYQAPSHTMSPKGPVSSIKRHEFILRPKITFEIAIATAVMGKLPDEHLARVLYHFGEHGLGACRSQGFGRFDVTVIEEVGVVSDEEMAAKVEEGAA